jgi:hypothetical protein
MSLSFTIAADLTNTDILRSESRGTHEHILLSQIRDSPNLEGQVLVFISPRNRVARLYPQALGSLLIASYNIGNVPEPLPSYGQFLVWLHYSGI